MHRSGLPAFVLFAALVGCGSVTSETTASADAAPLATPGNSGATPVARAAPVARPSAAFTALAGERTQGGWLRGTAPAGAVRVLFDGRPLPLAGDGSFFAAFDRDASGEARLVAELADGRTVTETIAVSPRSWQIEHVNVARRPGGASSEAFMERRRPELARINAARNVDHAVEGWRQQFIWPVKGRISGRFGSQRIYKGEPASYHSGIDIATGESGTPFVAPADGVVTLAAQTPFSLEGHLLIIDHGNGLNSAFLHCSKLAVQEGEVVRQGQYVGNLGATGRTTGPHLHWGIKWRDARLDPLLFTGPMR